MKSVSYVIRRKRTGMFNKIVETLGVDGHFYLVINAGVKKFDKLSDARQHARVIDETLKDKDSEFFIENSRGKRYDA